jgi:ATP-dependent helicase/nuclease subunit A
VTGAGGRAAKAAKATVAQRRAAVPEASVWVAASAGTGKTKVLTDRVLSLLLNGTGPGRILCLTFTKAAAAEMANRLARRLALWATEDDQVLAEDLAALLGEPADEAIMTAARRLFARVLDVPGGMKIQTIHAFCQSLLGRFPLEAGVPPHFQVLDERSAMELLEAAREEVMSAAQGPAGAALAAALAEVTAHAHEQTFDELMRELIKERNRLARLLRETGGLQGLVAAVYRALEVRPGETRENLLAAATADHAFDLMGLGLAVEGLSQGGVRDQERGARIRSWLDHPEARAAGFADYLGGFFTKGGEGPAFSTLIHKEALAAAPGADAILAVEAERLAAARARLRAIAVVQATAALMTLGEAILAAYRRHKRAQAFLDYDDLILEVRDLLAREGIAPWVLFKLDGGLDHVLIDEAQDTNPEQWQVIQALTAEFFVGEGAREGPRTVFAVGDAKQSIYGFQRADPDAFAAMRGHFAARASEARQTWDRVDLEVSFRSTAAVLDAVDRVFADPEVQDGLLFGEAWLRHDPVRVGQAGLVELWPPALPDEAGDPAPWDPPGEHRGGLPARARLARLVAEKIRRWTQEATEPGDEAWLASKNRGLAPGDIMVLVRRRNEFVEELVRELKQRNVPVAGIDRMVLTDQLAVMDLVALGRMLLLPEDDLTLATVLKGPLVGLDEDQLFSLAHDRRDSLWGELSRRGRTDPAFDAAHQSLARLRARTDYVRPFELFAELLGPGRGRQRLVARLGPDANDPIDEFLSLALAYEREHAPSLEGFLHWLEAGAQEVKRDLEHGGGAVRIMTVHGAKGLQAPVVILPDTLQVPQPKRGLLWLEDRFDGAASGLALWPLGKDYDGPAATTARAAAKAAQDREYRRLLYVAMTRSEDRLYVCGWQTRNRPPAACWYNVIARAMDGLAEPTAFDFSTMIDQGWNGPGWRLAGPQRAAPDDEESVPGPSADLPAPPEWARSAPEPEPVPARPLVPSRPTAEAPAVRSPLGPEEGVRFQRGRLVHRLLQSLPDLPRADRAEAARRFLANPVHGLAAARQEEILNETLAVLDHPDFAEIFGPASRAEVPVVGHIANPGTSGELAHHVVSGQIDRLVVTEREVLIVDYKTNRPAPRNETQIPLIYLHQMAAYQSVLKEIYPNLPIRCALLWTDDLRLMQLSDALLANHAP